MNIKTLNQYLASVDYTGDDTTTDFTIPFKSLAKYLYIKVDDVLISNTLYTFTDNSDQVVFHTAPKLDSKIHIYRDSDAAAIKVDFMQNATLKEADLDTAYLANLALIQELYDGLIASGNNSILIDDLLKGFRYNKVNKESEVYFDNQLRLRSTADGIEVLTRIIASAIEADVTGNLTGDVIGNLTGNVDGNLTGDVTGNLTGHVNGSLTGNVIGNLQGNVVGNVTGDLTGNVYRDGLIHVKTLSNAGTELYFNGDRKLTTTIDGGRLIGKWSIDTPVATVEMLVFNTVVKCIARNYGIDVFGDINLSGTLNRGSKVAMVIDDTGAVSFPNTPAVPVDLTAHDIQELRNVPPLEADRYLKVNAAGDAVEYTTTPLPANMVTTDTEQTITASKTFTDAQYLKLLYVYETAKDSGLGIQGQADQTVFIARDAGTERTAMSISHDGKVNLVYQGVTQLSTEVGYTYRGVTIEQQLQFKSPNSTVNWMIWGGSGATFAIRRLDGDGVSTGNNVPYLVCQENEGVELFYNGTGVCKTKVTTVAGQDSVYGLSVGGPYTRSGITLDSSDTKYMLFSEKDGSFGNIHQRNAQDVWEKDCITWRKNGGVELNYNGAKTLETVSNGITVSKGDDTWAYVNVLGNNARYALYAGGPTGYCGIGQYNPSTGAFERTCIAFRKGAATELYYNGAKSLETTSDGISIYNGPNNYSQVYLQNANATGWHRLFSSSVDDSLNLSPSPGLKGYLNGTWTGSITPSSLDLKTNIQPINGLAKIQLLQPLQWDWDRPEYASEQHETIGFSAESYEKVFPELIGEYSPIEPHTGPEGPEGTEDTPITQEEQEKIEYFKGTRGIKKAITSMKMDALVVDAIQQLANDNHALRLRIEALEARGDK